MRAQATLRSLPRRYALVRVQPPVGEIDTSMATETPARRLAPSDHHICERKMQPLPHLYSVSAEGPSVGPIALSSKGAPTLLSAPPVEFDGPGDQWSPESLLIAALASCFILTFRAVARASKLDWTHLECEVRGRLERIDGVTRFTHITTLATLTAPPHVSEELCQRALEKAEHGCLVSNSLSATRELEAQVVIGQTDAAVAG